MTQKTESVREAEQRNPAEKFFSESPRNAVTNYLAYEFEDIERDIIFDFAVAYAKSVTLKLAEEAEREPRSIWKSLPQCCGYPKCDGDLVGLKHSSECALYNKPEPTPAQRVAAWLREKAR